MNDPKQDYEPPEIIFEADMEANAGGSPFDMNNLPDPLDAEAHGFDWPIESDFLPPEE